MAAAVYVQTNDATENEIVAFSRAEDGTLAPFGALLHGWAGDRPATPALAGLGCPQRGWSVAAGRERGQRRAVGVRG